MQKKISKLQQKAKQIRLETLKMICSAKKGHIGGAFSCTDILVSLYYGNLLRISPSLKNHEERDRFILSKGHSAASLYAILSDLGFFPRQHLEHYQKKGSLLGGHPDRRIPGIEADTGSLGHGLGIGAGLALSAKLDKKKYLTAVLLGDGECAEGSVWEAALFASQNRLNNLIAILDSNGIASTDFIKNSINLEPIAKKWESFGWEAKEINGHSYHDLLTAFSRLRNRKCKKPLIIIAKTIKGKGVSFMENNPAWHHGVPKDIQLETAKKELGG